MAIQRFEDIIAWQKAQDLAYQIYLEFNNLRDFGFRDQIRRAVVSISNNIAEGFDRRTDADFSRFIYYAIGSCSEEKSMLYLAARLNYIETEKSRILIEQTIEISKISHGLIKTLSKNNVS